MYRKPTRRLTVQDCCEIVRHPDHLQAKNLHVGLHSMAWDFQRGFCGTDVNPSSARGRCFAPKNDVLERGSLRRPRS